MKCEECLPLVELHFDGELDARVAADVDAHLDACAACAGEYRKLEEERALFLTYECDAQPAPGFWDDVLAKVGAETAAHAAAPPLPRFRARLSSVFTRLRAPRLSPATVALLLLVAVGATVAVMKYAAARVENSAPVIVQTNAPRNEDEAAARPSTTPEDSGASNDVAQGVEKGAGAESDKVMRADRRDRAAIRQGGAKNFESGKKSGGASATQLRVAQSAPTGAQHETAPERLVREAEEKYLAAIRLLTRDVGRRRTQIDPDARLRFDETLAAVDRTIADTRRAARERPRDPVAVQYMLTAYAKKVELLREMARY